MSINKKNWTTLLGVLLAPVLIYYSLVQGLTATVATTTTAPRVIGWTEFPPVTAPAAILPDLSSKTMSLAPETAETEVSYGLSLLSEASNTSSSEQGKAHSHSVITFPLRWK